MHLLKSLLPIAKNFNRLLAFVQRDYADAASYSVGFGTDVVGALASIFSFYFLSKIMGQDSQKWLASYGGSYLSFVMLGLVFLRYMETAFNSVRRSINRHQLIGTFELLMVTPTRPWQLVTYSGCYEFLWSTVIAVIYFVFGRVVFGVSFPHANILSTIVVFTLTMISLCSLGFMSAAFAIVLKKSDPFTWLLTGLSTALGGIVYPISVLPSGLREFSEVLPVTLGLNAIRLAMLKGASLEALLVPVIGLLLWAAVLLSIAVVVVNHSIAFARRHGILAQY